MARPVKFSVYTIALGKTTRTRGGKTVPCFDVLYRVDGRRFRKRFTPATGGKAAARQFAEQLRAGANNPDLVWDEKNKRWIPDPKVGLTVGKFLLDFWTLSVGSWSPATRARNAAGLRRAVLSFATCEPDSAVVEELETFLTPQAVCGPHLDRFVSEESFKLREVDSAAVQMLLNRFPASQKRWSSVLSSAFELALARQHISRNPFAGVVWAKNTSPVRGEISDLTCSPAQVWQLAEHVGKRRADYKILVLLMGVCGLRISEARALRVKDVEGSWLKVSRSALLVGPRWVGASEDEQVGPLKGRLLGQYRKVPVPDRFARVLATHVEGKAEQDLVCVGRTGQMVNVSSFGRNVWAPAVEELFGGTELANLRRHDLRHAACSAWLTAGVDPKVAQTWSGHASLSVFLNIYQAVLDGQNVSSAQKFNDWSDC